MVSEWGRPLLLLMSQLSQFTSSALLVYVNISSSYHVDRWRRRRRRWRSVTVICSRGRSISGLQPPRLILPDRKWDRWPKLSHRPDVYRAGGSRGHAGGKGEGRGEVREAAGRWSEPLIKEGITWRHVPSHRTERSRYVWGVKCWTFVFLFSLIFMLEIHPLLWFPESSEMA